MNVMVNWVLIRHELYTRNVICTFAASPYMWQYAMYTLVGIRIKGSIMSL